MPELGPIRIDDPDEACPVPLEMLGLIYRADAEALADLTAGIPEHTRARLAVYLYGRSHMHELGIRIAAGCEGSALRRAAGLVGNALYERSRRPCAWTSPSHSRSPSAKAISLGGSKVRSDTPKMASRGRGAA